MSSKKYRSRLERQKILSSSKIIRAEKEKKEWREGEKEGGRERGREGRKQSVRAPSCRDVLSYFSSEPIYGLIIGL